MEYQIVYVDVLFLINFSMDYLVLYITAALLYLPKNAKRLLLSSLLGAIYEICIVVWPGHFMITFLTSIGVSILLCAVAFDFSVQKTGKGRSILIFYFINLLFGGAINAVMHLLQHLRPGAYRDSMQPDIKRIILLAACVLTLALLSVIRRRRAFPGEIVQVDITYDQNLSQQITCLVDSGNLLTEPFSGLPVILCTMSAVPYKRIMEQMEKRHKTCWIPTTTANGTSMLQGCLPKEITINCSKQRKRDTNKEKAPRKTTCQAAIAFTSQSVLHNGRTLDGLIPAVLIDM